nr:MAG TPA: hypothetical protein [Caudoviricetes sp.]
MDKTFEMELRETLVEIKTKQESSMESLAFYLEKTQTQEVELKTIENNIRTLFKRIDELRLNEKENRAELTRLIEDKYSEIFKLAAVMSGVISIFISVLAIILK